MQQIMIIKMAKRRSFAEELQKILTQYGCIIKMRLGLHEAGDSCSDEGLMILQLVPGAEETSAFQKELDDLEGVKTKLVEI